MAREYKITRPLNGEVLLKFQAVGAYHKAMEAANKAMENLPDDEEKIERLVARAAKIAATIQKKTWRVLALVVTPEFDPENPPEGVLTVFPDLCAELGRRLGLAEKITKK